MAVIDAMVRDWPVTATLLPCQALLLSANCVYLKFVGVQGNTALMHACKSGQDQTAAYKIGKLLLATGAQVLAANFEVVDLIHMM